MVLPCEFSANSEFQLSFDSMALFPHSGKCNPDLDDKQFDEAIEACLFLLIATRLPG